jgi:nicotinate-nucleotide adenylyltransferase
MNVGCLFGTFDPPHYGHTAIASHMRLHGGLDEVWLVVTPRNPFKQDRPVSPDADRMAMVRAATSRLQGVMASDVELGLAPPNYTVDTLAVMRKRWPHSRFDLIIGSDNLAAFDRWKDPEGILAHHRLLVYPRPGVEMHFEEAVFRDHPQVEVVEAPFLTISATRVREMVRRGQDVSGLIDPDVWAHIRSRGLYTS